MITSKGIRNEKAYKIVIPNERKVIHYITYIGYIRAKVNCVE